MNRKAALFYAITGKKFRGIDIGWNKSFTWGRPDKSWPTFGLYPLRIWWYK